MVLLNNINLIAEENNQIIVKLLLEEINMDDITDFIKALDQKVIAYD